ncbi:MAG: hypothetical protein KAI74_04620, partial [Kiritimatiellae bacterium]|nr:hypothetical protein [Kiritimatiellia bacterium]
AASGDIISIEDAVHTEQGIVIDKSLTIQGQGADSTVLQAHASRSNATDRIFTISGASVVVTIKNMTLQHGQVTAAGEDGGAIKFAGGSGAELTIEDCVLTKNDASDLGGAIYGSDNNDTVAITVRRCTISDNTAINGGGIYVFRGSAFTMEECTLSGNIASSNGGGLFEHSYMGISKIKNCTFSGNEAVTAHGGGAFAYGNDFQSVGTCYFYNCSFIGNHGGTYAGGLRTAGASGGIDQVELYSCLFAGNTTANSTSYAIFGQSDYFVISNCVWEGTANFSADAEGGNQAAIGSGNAKVSGTLADNGGATKTHALLAGSICITNGSNVANLTTDQRGSGYDRAINGIADVGAYEYLSGPSIVIYANNEFTEAQSDIGAIDNGTPLVINLVKDTFTDSTNALFSASKYSVLNLPSGLSVVMTNVNGTQLSVTLTGTESPHTAADSIDDLTFVFDTSAFISGSLPLNSSNGTLKITFGDKNITYNNSTFSEGVVNNGTIDTVITGTLGYETFSQAVDTELVPTYVTPGSVPSGLAASVKVASPTTVTVTLTGTAVAHNVGNDIANISLTFLGTAFAGGTAANVDGYNKTDFAVSYIDPALAYVNTDFTESTDNDGSMGNSVVVTLAGDDFIAGVESGGLVVGNMPAGLEASTVMDDSAQITVSLTGNATASDSSNSISNLSFTFGNSSFAGGNAAVVTNAVKSDLTVTFIDALFVSQSEGSDATGDGAFDNPYATITNAIAHATAGGVVEIMDSVHTESDITVDVDDLLIIGQGADQTIVQAATAMGLASNRIFSVTSAGLTLRDMTLRYGDVADEGGVINEIGDPANGLTVLRCSFEDNKSGAAGGAINWTYSPLTVKDCTFTRNTAATSGGAIYFNSGYVNTPFYVDNSTFSTNVATLDDGGAVYHYSSKDGSFMQGDNLSFINNHCGDGVEDDWGGAVYAHYDNVFVESCLFAGNSSGSVDSTDGYNLSYSNTVYEGEFRSSSNKGGNISTNDAGVNMVLADNGGSTMTHALLKGSIAIDAGSNPLDLTSDQRGTKYVRVINSIADCGAYEYGSGPAAGWILFIR